MNATTFYNNAFETIMNEAFTIWEQAHVQLVSNTDLHYAFLHLYHTVKHILQEAKTNQFDNPTQLLTLRETKRMASGFMYHLDYNRRFLNRLIDEFCHDTLGVWVGLSGERYRRLLRMYKLEYLSEYNTTRWLTQF